MEFSSIASKERTTKAFANQAFCSEFNDDASFVTNPVINNSFLPSDHPYESQTSTVLVSNPRSSSQLSKPPLHQSNTSSTTALGNVCDHLIDN